MLVGSLFSGVGGLDLGLERAGMRIAWQCEADPYCRRVLARHWPGIPCYHDVRLVNERAPRVDVIAGGFPCQPVSLAGRGLAQADERWLWPEYARCIRLLRPRFVVVENVPGLLARGFGDVLGDLAALGFDAEWCVFGARDVGAPHRRDRVWIVAADADREQLRLEPWRSCRPRRPGAALAGNDGAAQPLADAPCRRRGTRTHRHKEDDPARSGRDDAAGGSGWSVEPDVGRVAHGIPARVDRLRALGNAVVPACAEHIGRLLMTRAVAAANPTPGGTTT